jgi:hypothetical protein
MLNYKTINKNRWYIMSLKILCALAICASTCLASEKQEEFAIQHQNSPVEFYNLLTREASNGNSFIQHELLDIAVQGHSMRLLQERMKQSCIQRDTAALAEALFYLNHSADIEFINRHFGVFLIPSKMNEIQEHGTKESAFALYQFFLAIKNDADAYTMLQNAAKKDHLTAQHLLLEHAISSGSLRLLRMCATQSLISPEEAAVAKRRFYEKW